MKHPLPTLKNKQEFGSVYQNGRSYANRYLVMYVCGNGLNYNRIGISVSKKVGNSVVRHRVTRLIRESLRLHGDRFSTGLDIIVIARGTAKGRGQAEITSAVLHLAGLHRIVLKEETAVSERGNDETNSH